MMQKTIFTILVTLIFGLNCHSQVPGYMGHRFSVEGDLNVLPWFTNALKGNKRRSIIKKVGNVSYYYYEDRSGEYKYKNNNYIQSSKLNSDIKNFTFNLRSSLSLNYTVSKTVDLSLRLNYTNSQFVLKNFDKQQTYNRLPFFSSEKDQIPYQLMEYNFNFKIYTSKFIAPVGNYFLFGIGYSQASSDYSVSYIYNDYSKDNEITKTTYETKNIKGKASFFKFNVGFYKKRFISEKLYITTGLELNSYFLGKYSMKKAFLSGYQYYSRSKMIDKKIKENYKFNIGRHISIDNQHTFNIGIGLIL